MVPAIAWNTFSTLYSFFKEYFSNLKLTKNQLKHVLEFNSLKAKKIFFPLQTMLELVLKIDLLRKLRLAQMLVILMATE